MLKNVENVLKISVLKNVIDIMLKISVLKNTTYIYLICELVAIIPRWNRSEAEATRSSLTTSKSGRPSDFGGRNVPGATEKGQAFHRCT